MSEAPTFQLVVGLGNAPTCYSRTRHNAGQWLLNKLTTTGSWKPHRDGGMSKVLEQENKRLALFRPPGYINQCGPAIAKRYKKLCHSPASLLILHDDLDLAPGTIRLKHGGGTGGHRGLRSLIDALGGVADFYRLRIGIGHPGQAAAVVDYVLTPPTKTEKQAIDNGIQEVLAMAPALLFENALATVQQSLHQRRAVVSSDLSF